MSLKPKIIYHLYNIKFSEKFQRHSIIVLSHHMNNDLVIGYHLVRVMLEDEYGSE